MTQFVPAIKEGSGMENALQMHFVSKTSNAAGHIDDITLSEGTTIPPFLSCLPHLRSNQR